MSFTTTPSSGMPLTTSDSTALKGKSKKKDPLKDADKRNQLISWVNEQYESCRSLRQTTERQWYINLAMYFGKQYITTLPISSTSGAATGVRLFVPPAPYYRARPIINRIRPAIRRELAKLTSQKPSASIVPASSEDRDLFAAEAGEQVWESVYSRKKVKTVFRRSMFWTLTCGNGFIKSYWDATAVDMESNQMGDFVYESVTPFHIFVSDLMIEDLEDQPYVIHATTKSPEWVQMNYGIENVQPNVMEAQDIFNDSFLNLVGSSDMKQDAVLVLEVWIKPGQYSQFPDGGMVTVVGDQIAEFTEGWPYLHNQYPFIKFDHVPTGRFYSESVITDLVPIQRELNRTRGQIIEAKNRMAKPQLIAPEGSVDPAKITTEPGQVILYKPGFNPPQPLPLQPLPNYVTQEVERLLMDINDISGQHEVSKGGTPPGVTAATAISYLQEQDETMLSATYDSVEEGLEKLGYQTLTYVKQFWDTQRIVKVVGTDGSFGVLAFQGSDLGGNTDIRIEAGSALPTSKAAKQAFVMDLMKMGFIDPNKGLEVMEMGGINKIYERIKVDERQAQRENLRMQAVTQEQLDMYYQSYLGPPDPMSGAPSLIDPNTGQPLVDQMTGMPIEPPLIVPVNNWDSHELHIKIHNDFRKSQAFETLGPEIKQLFEEHVQLHASQLMPPPGMEPEGPMGPEQLHLHDHGPGNEPQGPSGAPPGPDQGPAGPPGPPGP